jgi:hypothetical protein
MISAKKNEIVERGGKKEKREEKKPFHIWKEMTEREKENLVNLHKK